MLTNKADLSNIITKDRNSVISTSTKSSSSIHSSDIQNAINLLKDDNASLQKRIINIKLSQRTSHSNRISFLKSYHKGHRLKIQLNKANTIYRQFINLFTSNVVTNSNRLLNKLKQRFSTIISNRSNQHLLDSIPQDQLHLPYKKLLPKVHKLDRPASHNNITELTGRSTITAHSWTTSNPSRLLGTELDNIILQLK